ncbi:hypothetical protein PV11_03002 [Exophiala sideris]|uniref:Protein kinase domain-containing protein n=1 Tax=Exophiala sideris TaxID=1016849 RepID=A0A0D1ZKY8_9EURO|nr:hypothetical protein PV11_03002 [Exophiala sideris]
MASTQQGSPRDQPYDPSPYPDVQQYLHWIDLRRCEGITFEPDSSRSRTFIPDSAIKQYFDCTESSNYEKVKNLVTAAAGPYEPPNPRDVAQRCPKVFTILLIIGQSKYLNWFIDKDNLRDRRLPFTAEARSHFPRLPNGETFFDEFCKRQWQFCVEPMTHGTEPLTFDPERILPISEIEEVNKHQGASGVVQKVVVHPHYDRLHQSGLPHEAGRHEYVIKAYHRIEAEKYFKVEVGAFQKLVNEYDEPVPNLIRFYGAFKQNDSFHVILEYANVGTLEDYFNKVQPPRLGHDILSLWTNVFQLNHALAHIHNTSHNHNGYEAHVTGSPRIFQGWHQDIKPANILVSGDLKERPYEVQFMLADLGLSHFTAVVEHEDEVTGEDTGGSRAYSAPESNLAKTPVSKFAPRVKQSIDTWSLACVYSEFNVWIVDGAVHGLERYRSARLREAESRGSPLGACFHNSRGELLQTVIDWHQELHRRRAHEDKVTEVLWDQLLKRMFRPKETRITALLVAADAEDVIEKAKSILEQSCNKDQTASPAFPPEDWSRPRTPPNVPEGFQGSRQHPADHSNDPITPPAYENGSKEQRTPARTIPYRSAAHGLNNPGTDGNRVSLTSRLSDNSESNAWGGPSGEPWSRPFSATQGDFGSTMFPDNEQVVSPSFGQDSIPHRTSDISRRGYVGGVGHFRRATIEPSPIEQYQPPSLATINPAPGQRENENKGKWKERSADLKPKARNPTKVLTRDALRHWAEKTRLSRSGIFGSNQEHHLDFEEELLGELRQRDHIFVLDDGESMRLHWKSVLALYKDLVLLVKKKKLDPNGSELRFITSDQRKEKKNTTELIAMVTAMEYHLRGESNFAARLEKILEEYTNRLRKNRDRRPISLYVFTDGRWQTNTGQLREVADAIKRMVLFLADTRAVNKKVGIQFIQFGHDELGTQRLTWLDKDLPEEYKLPADICDTTPSDGPDANVWKMLLGSIRSLFDDD